MMKCYTYDQMKIVAAMKDIVPEFVSKNSCFEVLDKKEQEPVKSETDNDYDIKERMMRLS